MPINMNLMLCLFTLGSFPYPSHGSKDMWCHCGVVYTAHWGKVHIWHYVYWNLVYLVLQYWLICFYVDVKHFELPLCMKSATWIIQARLDIHIWCPNVNVGSRFKCYQATEWLLSVVIMPTAHSYSHVGDWPTRWERRTEAQPKHNASSNNSLQA